LKKTSGTGLKDNGLAVLISQMGLVKQRPQYHSARITQIKNGESPTVTTQARESPPIHQIVWGSNGKKTSDQISPS